MKPNIHTVATSLVAMSFTQFASPAALSALCTHFDTVNNKPSVLKIVVQDDWKIASIIPLEPGIVFRIPCDSSKSMSEEFKCSEYFDVFEGMSYTFSRDVKNKMTFVVKTNLHSEEVRTTTFDCVKE